MHASQKSKYAIDKNSFAPAYYQLAKAIEEKIIKGELLPGEKLDSEKEISAHSGLSRVTVRRALEIIIKKGLIYTERGRGTFVSNLDIDDAMFRVTEFQSDMRDRGLEPDTKQIDINFIEPDSFITEKLGIENGEVLLIRSVKFAGDEPMVYEKRYIQVPGRDLELPTETQLKEYTFSRLVESTSKQIPIKSSMTIRAVALLSEEAGLLQQKKGAPGFSIEQLLYSFNEKPVALGLYIYRGDRHTFKSTFSY